MPKWITRQIESKPEKYIPYAGHVEPDIGMTMDNSIFGMIHLHGLPFELLSRTTRNARMERINTLLRSLADTDLSLCINLVRHRGASAAPQPISKNEFVRGLMYGINATTVEGKSYRNDWFITAIVHPAASTVRAWGKWWPWAKPQPLVMGRSQRQRLQDVIQMIMSTLSEYEPTRLGIKEIPTDIEGETLPITEIGTALHLIRTAILEPIPHTTGPLGSAIYTDPVTCGTRHFNLNKSGMKRVGAMVGLKNYPAKPRVGMFNALLSAPYPLVMSHSFRFRSQGATVTAMSLIQDQMESAGDKATDLSDGLTQAMNSVTSMKTASGMHHAGLAVYADNTLDLDTNVADASKRLMQFGGAVPIREMNVWYNGALESAYYLQLPGSPIFQPRPGDISTLDLACMASLDNYPLGHAEGYWGPSTLRLLTNGLTIYDLIQHVEDVGHTWLVGRTGSGKTALLGAIIAALDAVMGADGIRLVIDKDEGNRLLIEQCGGTYNCMRRNQESGLAPLVAFPNTPASRAFFHGLYTWLILRDGRRTLTGLEDTRLMRGIARQLRMPPAKRSMWGVREFLGYSDPENGAGARFEKWCAGGSMGWLLDNRQHVITLGAGLYGFDFTDLIPQEGVTDDGACSVAAAVITHQLAGLMDGRRIAAFFDESKFYMIPLKRMIDDYTITGRKKEVMCWLIAQQPDHFTSSDMGMSLIAQCRTKIIFPDANSDDDGLRKAKISEPAIAQLKGDMTLGNARRFLLWRPEAPAICEWDLTGLPQLSILSSKSKRINLMKKIEKENVGDTQEEILKKFYQKEVA